MKTTWKIALALVIVSFAFIGYTKFTMMADRVVQAGENDAFAHCLTENGAVFYGAYWCPHCGDQKEMLGSSMEFINYVECDPKGRNAQPELCAENNIRGYPTWIINGKKYEGVQSLEKLSELTGCSLT